MVQLESLSRFKVAYVTDPDSVSDTVFPGDGPLPLFLETCLHEVSSGQHFLILHTNYI